MTAINRPIRFGNPVRSLLPAGSEPVSCCCSFADIGLFDEEFFAYFEDVDLSFRGRLAGHRVRYCADAVAYHDQGATSRTMAGFATRQFFRNLPLLLVKNVPARLLPSVVARFALIYSLMVLYQFRRGQARPAVRGVAESVGLVARGLSRRRVIQRSRRSRRHGTSATPSAGAATRNARSCAGDWFGRAQ